MQRTPNRQTNFKRFLLLCCIICGLFSIIATGGSTVNEVTDNSTDQSTRYTVTVTTSGQGSVSLNPSGGTYNSGDTVTLTATPASGYTFSGWSGGLSGTNTPATMAITADVTITATFTRSTDSNSQRELSLYNQSPTYQKSFTTTNSSITISGMGNGAIGTITWTNTSNNQSGTGTVTVDSTSQTTTWSTDIDLQPGENEIEITGTASDGSDSVTLALTVMYNRSIDFSSLPEITPDAGLLGQSYNDVYVRVAISSTDVDSSTVALYKVANGEKTGTPLGILTDDGDLNNGDEIQGDGIYSTKIELSATQAGQVSMRIYADNITEPVTESSTATFTFTFFTPPTAAELAQQVTLNDSAMSQINSLLNAGGSTSSTLDSMVTYLKGLDGIADAGKTGYGVWWLNDIGMFNVLSTSDFTTDEKLGTVPAQTDHPVNRSVPVEYLKHSAPTPLPKFTQQAQTTDDEAQYNIGSFNAVHISPFKQVTDWYNTKAGGKAWDTVVVKSQCPTFNTTAYINNTADPQSTASPQAPLSVWKHLSDYGLISTLTHGDTLNVSKSALEQVHPELVWVDWLFPWQNQRVVMFTNIEVDFTREGLDAYLVDILAGRLMLFPSGPSKVLLMVTPEFISTYNGNFPNSIWYSMSCRSAFNDTMAAVFLAKGGGAYYGFSEYVAATYAFGTQTTVFKTLIDDGQNAGEAFDAAVAAHGANDGGEPAALVLYGEKQTQIGSSELKNGSFEDPDGAGSLNGWTTDGDGRVLKVLGGDSPTVGNSMGIISSGLGFTDEYGAIAQTVCLPDNVKNLKFDWNFYSEEFKEFCNLGYDDTFSVSLTDIETGTSVTLFTTSVDTICGACDGSDPTSDACSNLPLTDSATSFDRGDVWDTTWERDETVDISAYKGKSVVLEFYIEDKGDNAYDTAVLIDHVQITTQ